MSEDNQSIYTAPYLETHSVCSFLDKYIMFCLKEFRDKCAVESEKYVAPYISLCQSSGMGKTSTALQMRNMDYLVFYMCLRPVNSSGEPSRTTEMAELLANVKEERDCLHLFRTIFSVFQANWMGAEASSVANFHQSFGMSDFTFWSDVRKQYDLPFKEVEYNTLASNCNASVLKILNKLKSLGCKTKAILFIFDEARVLLGPEKEKCKCQEKSQEDGDPDEELSPFRLLRRALSVFKTGNLAALFMDTTSKVANFSPSVGDDPSLRRAAIGRNLFAPFTVFPGFGALPVKWDFCKSYEETCMGLSNGELRYNRFDDISLCRPMFAQHINRNEVWDAIGEEAIDVYYPDLVQLATSKLMLTKVAKEVKEIDTYVAMAVRFCLLPMSTTVLDELVSSRMATLLTVNLRRTRLDARYEAEPILGEAVCNHMRQSGVFLEHLKNLSDMRHNQEIGILHSQGDVGEFCAAVVLGRAMDIAHEILAVNQNIHYGAPVPLHMYLSCLLGHKFTMGLNLSPSLQRSFVKFTQFVKCEGPIDVETLLQAVLHGVALWCQVGEATIDIVVPLIVLGDNQRLHLRDLTHQNLSLIMVQVKNNHSTTPVSVSRMTKFFVDSPTFANKILRTATVSKEKSEAISSGLALETGIKPEADPDVGLEEENAAELDLPIVTILMDVGISIQKGNVAQPCRNFASQWIKQITEIDAELAKISVEYNELDLNISRVPEPADPQEAAKVQVRIDSLAVAGANLKATRRAISLASLNPCIVVQTLGNHYEFFSSEELDWLKELAKPVDDYVDTIDGLAHLVGMSAEDRLKMLKDMRPVVGLTMGK